MSQVSIQSQRNKFLDWVDLNKDKLNFFFKSTPTCLKSLMSVPIDFLIPDKIPRFDVVNSFETKDQHKQNKKMALEFFTNIQWMMNAYSHLLIHDKMTFLNVSKDQYYSFMFLMKDFIEVAKFPNDHPFLLCFDAGVKHLNETYY